MDWKQERHGNQQWRVWCEESGGWEYQKWSGEYGRLCKVEDSHRVNMEQRVFILYWILCWIGSQWRNWNRGVMWSVLHFFSMRWAAQFYMQARKEKTAVVKAWQNEWGDQFHCSLSGKILPDVTNLMELVVAWFGSLTSSSWAVCCPGEHRGFWRSQRGRLWHHQAEGCWQK